MAKVQLSPSFISLLVGVATSIVVSLLLIGTQQEEEEAAWAQPADAPQVYCGPWQIESRSPSREIGNWQFWTYRWCYSPEVSGGWYKDYAGYQNVPDTTLDVTLTYTPSSDSVAVGEPVTFTATETNNESYALTGMNVAVHPNPEITSLTGFVSVTLSQGQCEFPLSQGGYSLLFPSLNCYLGTIPPGDTAVIDLVVVPQEPGIISTSVRDAMAPISEGRRVNGPQLTWPSVEASVSVYSAGEP